MKKSLLIVAVVLALLAAACGKDRTCRCTPKNTTDGEATILTMDHGMSCSSVTQLGFERQIEGYLVRSMVEVECLDEVPENE